MKALSRNERWMDLNRIIRRLVEEKKQLDLVISSLETLQKNGAHLVLTNSEPPAERRGRKLMSAEERSKVSARMKKYWQARRENQEGPGLSGAERMAGSQTASQTKA